MAERLPVHRLFFACVAVKVCNARSGRLSCSHDWQQLAELILPDANRRRQLFTTPSKAAVGPRVVADRHLSQWAWPILLPIIGNPSRLALDGNDLGAFPQLSR